MRQAKFTGSGEQAFLASTCEEYRTSISRIGVLTSLLEWSDPYALRAMSNKQIIEWFSAVAKNPSRFGLNVAFLTVLSNTPPEFIDDEGFALVARLRSAPDTGDSEADFHNGVLYRLTNRGAALIKLILENYEFVDPE